MSRSEQVGGGTTNTVGSVTRTTLRGHEGKKDRGGNVAPNQVKGHCLTLLEIDVEEMVELELDLTQLIATSGIQYDPSRILEDHGTSERPLPLYPTHYLPGSIEKMRVMEERYAQGLHIHHPLDARGCVAKR